MNEQVIYTYICIFLICSLEFLFLKEKYFRIAQVPEKNKHLDKGLTLKRQVFRVWENIKDNSLIYLAI